jgi:hypothetical protein
MSRKYEGDLAKPIKLKPPPLLYTPAQYEAWVKAHVAELVRRMGLLQEAHGVKAGDGDELSWSLALDLPGFQLAKVGGRGRRKVWNQFVRTLLALSIEELQALGLSITKATERLANEEPWKLMVVYSYSRGASQLRDEYTRLSDFERDLVRIFRDYKIALIAAGEIIDEPGAFARKFTDELTRKTS